MLVEQLVFRLVLNVYLKFCFIKGFILIRNLSTLSVFAQLSVLFPDSREMLRDLEDEVGLSLSSSGGCSTLLS